jgi:hypothetical protein
VVHRLAMFFKDLCFNSSLLFPQTVFTDYFIRLGVSEERLMGPSVFVRLSRLSSHFCKNVFGWKCFKMALRHTVATMISLKTDVAYHSCLSHKPCYVIPFVALVTHHPWCGVKNTSAWSVHSREYRLSICSFLKPSPIVLCPIPRPVSKHSSKWQLVSVRKHQTFYCYFAPVCAHAY